MKKALLLGVVSLLMIVTPLMASSHKEAPGLVGSPAVDNTDVWGWRDSDDTIVVIAGFNPMSVPSGGPNYSLFDPAASYYIYVDTNGDGAEEISYKFTFENVYHEDPNTFLRITTPPTYASPTSAGDPIQALRQTYTVWRNGTMLAEDVPVAPPNTGPKFTPNYPSLATSAISTTSEGGHVFAGPRQDAFFIDLGATFDKLTIRDFDARGNVGNKGGGFNTIAGFNIDVIALQIPRSTLGGAATAGVWSAVEMPRVTVRGAACPAISAGPSVQVSRLGNPLMDELFIPIDLKDSWNALDPTADLATFGIYFLDPEPARLLNIIYGLPLPPTPRTDLAILLPDTLKIAANGPVLTATGTAFFGNAAGPLLGRTLADDIVDIYLQAAAGLLVPGFPAPPPLGDGVDFAASGVRTLPSFPYIYHPYSGLETNIYMRQTPPRD